MELLEPHINNELGTIDTQGLSSAMNNKLYHINLDTWNTLKCRIKEKDVKDDAQVKLQATITQVN